MKIHSNTELLNTEININIKRVRCGAVITCPSGAPVLTHATPTFFNVQGKQ